MTAILLIYTGGTIGMVEGPAGLEPGAGVLERGLAALTPEGLSVTVEQFTPLIDSASIRPEDWNRMLERIESWQGDGVIVVHGTDTMAYTGAALSCALHPCRLPVVLCGAMVPLGQGGDAEANLSLALSAVCQQPPGVWLAFAGQILPALGLVKHSSTETASFRATAQSPNQDPNPKTARRFAPRRLAVLSLSPGLPAAALGAALAQLDGAVLRVYGAGTMMQDAALHATLAAAIAGGCRVRAVSQCESGGLEPAAYAAGAALWSAGVENGGTETAELALARLWLSLS